MNRRRFLPLLLLPLTHARACLWDSDTLRDEAVQKGSLYDFITGQFPHHSSAYYQARVKRLLAAGKLDHAQRNDLAAAHIRLEQWEKAETLLKENLAAQPGDYFTLSNLGVMEKKRGNYAASAEWTAKALAIKPDGHLGLGDWYLKNLQYRTAVAAAPDRIPEKDFLGAGYAGSFKPDFEKSGLPAEHTEAAQVLKEYRLRLQRMLENDQTFADGFLVTGDSLVLFGDLNLAFLCYKRAAELKHPCRAELNRRIKALYAHFTQISFDGGGGAAYKKALSAVQRKHDQQAMKAFSAASAWHKKFQETEAELVATHGDEKTTVELVEATLSNRGVKRPLP